MNEILDKVTAFFKQELEKIKSSPTTELAEKTPPKIAMGVIAITGCLALSLFYLTIFHPYLLLIMAGLYFLRK